MREFYCSPVNVLLFTLLAAMIAITTACSPSTPSDPPELTVTITAEPSEGLAPLTVHLSGSVTGGSGNYSYA